MKRYFPIILLLVCGTALAAGIVQLFTLRFEVGDVYPPYSSLRSDPLGTMAIYEGLEKLPGLAVQRDLSTANRLPEGNETTYFQVATSSSAWRGLSEGTFKEIERFVSDGGRLVITMFPESYQPSRGRAPNPGPAESKTPTPYRDRWAVDFEMNGLARSGEVYEPATVRNSSGLPLPETLEWHSGMVFTGLNSDWKQVYVRGANAVLIERTLGRGSVVLATDSYFLSNEAMQRDRQTDLLVWLIGSSRNLMFDEAHLGVTAQPGIAALIRKYRLYWVVAALAVLAALFIWKMSVPLVPPRADAKSRDYVAGKDAAEGFVNLLRRSIPIRGLLATCFIEWKKSAAPSGKYSAVRIRQAEAMFEAAKDPVTSYRAISKILQSKTK